MGLRPRPPGLPHRVPARWWKWLKLPGRFHVRKPKNFWLWRKWRLGYKLPHLSKREKAVRYALAALPFAGKMVYSEAADRSQLFHRRPGDFAGAHADCSQFVSAILHWSGVRTVNEFDATGTLLQKGKLVSEPAFGRLVVFGPGSGRHTGMFTRHENDVWSLTEFGDQAAPDEITLPAAVAYFKNLGYPGVRYLDFFE